MQQVAGCSRSCALPNAARIKLARSLHQRPGGVARVASIRNLPQSTRLRHRCSASSEDQNNQSSSQNDVRPEVSKTKLADEGADNEVPKLGLAGTIVTWALLIVLFGGSLFFTFSRSFLPDMQPLDTQSPEIVAKF